MTIDFTCGLSVPWLGFVFVGLQRRDRSVYIEFVPNQGRKRVHCTSNCSKLAAIASATATKETMEASI